MSDGTHEAMIIAILVIVALIFVFQFEMYRNMLAIVAFHTPEAAPPMNLRWSNSFLSKKSKKQSNDALSNESAKYNNK